MGYLDHASNTIITIDIDGDSLEQKAEVLRKPCEGLYVKRIRSYDSYIYSMDAYKYEINSRDKSTMIINSLMLYLSSEEKIYMMFDKLRPSSISKITIHDMLNYNAGLTNKYKSEQIQSYDDKENDKIKFVKNKLNGKATRKVQTNERFYTFSSVLPYMRKIGDKPNELISKHPK